MKEAFIVVALAIIPVLACAEDGRKIRVVVWDEQQPAQKPVYANFLGNQIANYLKTQPEFTVTSVRMDDPEQGLSKEALDNCDVLIWWGHVRNRQVALDKSKDIAARVKSGQLSLVALHSAHWAQPFIECMNERAIADAQAKLSEEQRKTVKLKINPAKLVAPKRDAPLTPSSQLKKDADGSDVLEINLPCCVFPAWRADGAPSHVKTLLPNHSIAKEIPVTFDLPHTEMYDEPFHVPPPDDVVFEEKWDKGEHFRSGCVWNVGKGKVFYFRPGHETYGVYLEDIPLRIVANAVRWLGQK